MGFIKYSQVTRYNQLAITSSNNTFHFDKSVTKINFKSLTNDYIFLKINNEDFVLTPLEIASVIDIGFIKTLTFITVPCLITFEIFSS